MDRYFPKPLGRRGWRANRRFRRGVAAVEAALLLPLALLLMLGTWEVGRMVEVSQILNNAAREGGRSASTGSVHEQPGPTDRLELSEERRLAIDLGHGHGHRLDHSRAPIARRRRNWTSCRSRSAFRSRRSAGRRPHW